MSDPGLNRPLRHKGAKEEGPGRAWKSWQGDALRIGRGGGKVRFSSPRLVSSGQSPALSSSESCPSPSANGGVNRFSWTILLIVPEPFWQAGLILALCARRSCHLSPEPLLRWKCGTPWSVLPRVTFDLPDIAFSRALAWTAERRTQQPAGKADCPHAQDLHSDSQFSGGPQAGGDFSALKSRQIPPKKHLPPMRHPPSTFLLLKNLSLPWVATLSRAKVNL